MKSAKISIIIQVEKILSHEGIGDVELQPIIDEILVANDALNVLQMLSLSCEYNNYDAQCTYLSIISECVKVFERHISLVSSYRDVYISDSLYYYLEFLLGCNESNVKREYIDNLALSKDDMAYPLYLKLSDTLLHS